MSSSAIYSGTVTHRRHAPVAHSFEYRQRLLYLDLDEVPDLMRAARLWSMHRPAPGWFRRADYLGDPRVPLAAAVRAFVAERTGTQPAGPVRLLAHARTFWHCFNPVSFYFCFGDDPRAVEAVVAHVTNTPWGDDHAYVIDRRDARGQVIGASVEKALHVSPFMGMDQHYEIRVTEPCESLVVHIKSFQDSQLAFDATLALRREQMLTPAKLDRLLLRRPFETVRTVALIYANALRLKLKGVPYHPRPESPR